MLLKESIQRIIDQLNSVVMGGHDASYLLLVGLMARGHILIQDEPGLGKTTLVKALANSLAGTFKRIQFTPDLLPADILGYNIYDQSTQKFKFIDGPIFANFILADEINRASPRTQSAMLETMNESQVTIDGETRHLSKLFNVIATQNDLYSTGTFPLPEPQLDRFMLSFRIGIPSHAIQNNILLSHANSKPSLSVNAVLSEEEIISMQEDVDKVFVKDNVANYIIDLSEATRSSNKLVNGVSIRASISLMKAAQACAYIDERDSVYPDDIKKLIKPVFSHRLKVKRMATVKKNLVDDILDDILNKIKVP